MGHLFSFSKRPRRKPPIISNMHGGHIKYSRLHSLELNKSYTTVSFKEVTAAYAYGRKNDKLFEVKKMLDGYLIKRIK